MRTIGLLAVLAGLFMVAPWSASAITSGTSTHNYDTIPNPASIPLVGTTYAGFSYNTGPAPWGGTRALCAPYYNSGFYPPQTPPCIAADIAGGRSTIDADTLHGFTRVSGFCVGPGTGPPVKIEVYDIFGALSGSTSCAAFFTNAAFSVTCASPLSCYRVVLHDTANYWGYDTLRFTSLI